MSIAQRRTTAARMTGSWTTYAGSVHGVLQAAGMTDLDLSQTMGLTGMAFHLIVHETICPSSVTVYEWYSEHLKALDHLGMYSEIYEAMPGTVTYGAACRRAVDHVKASLDRGVGVILWGIDTGEFGVVYGYDDGDGVFLVDGVGRHAGGSNPVLYENFGKTFADAPILHCQVPVERVPYDLDRVFPATLRSYVDQMERTFHVCPNYQSGLRAYDNWLGALQAGTYNPFGLRYITYVYAEAKQHAAAYARYLADVWQGLPGLDDVAEAFAATAAVFDRMLGALGQRLEDASQLRLPVTPEQAGALVPLVREARRRDEEALRRVKAALAGA